MELLTAIGDDEKATLIEFYCQKERIGLTHALRLPGASSAYLCVHDENGDMIIAINDMALMDALPSDPPEAWLSIIQHSPLAILDANLPVPLFEAIVYAAKAPLLLDPVSTFKAERARRVIGRFAAVKPNRLEAKQLSGEDDPIKAAKWFHAQGVQKVFISLGADGVYFSDEGTQGILLAPQVAASDYTGAGDAMTGGIAYGMLMGHNAKGCALSGMEAVSDHLQSHR